MTIQFDIDFIAFCRAHRAIHASPRPSAASASRLSRVHSLHGYALHAARRPASTQPVPRECSEADSIRL